MQNVASCCFHTVDNSVALNLTTDDTLELNLGLLCVSNVHYTATINPNTFY